MSRLPAVTAREMVAALKRAGFHEHHQKGSHRYLWHPVRKRMTAVAMHAGDLPRGTVRAIIEQAGLAVEEFLEFL